MTYVRGDWKFLGGLVFFTLGKGWGWAQIFFIFEQGASLTLHHYVLKQPKSLF